jgi:hypothetical protein
MQRSKKNEQDHSQERMETCAKKQKKDLPGPALLEMSDRYLYRHWPLACENACYPNLRNWSSYHGNFGLNMAEGIAALRH